MAAIETVEAKDPFARRGVLLSSLAKALDWRSGKLAADLPEFVVGQLIGGLSPNRTIAQRLAYFGLCTYSRERRCKPTPDVKQYMNEFVAMGYFVALGDRKETYKFTPAAIMALEIAAARLDNEF